MNAVSIPLTDERRRSLQRLAEQAGLTPEEFLRGHVERFLDQPERGFAEAAAATLRKNAELYRRLA